MAIPLSTESDQSWNTPGWVLDLVRQILDRKIALDPCSNPTSQVAATISYALPLDGLSFNWGKEIAKVYGHCNELVFINPPFKKPLPWVEKATEQFESYPDLHLVMLLDAATDTRWFHDHFFPGCEAICFLKGRMKYLKNGKLPKGGGHTRPSVLGYWGPDPNRFEEVFEPYGIVL